MKKTFNLFGCCDAEEKNSIYYYYNQNEKYIKDNLGMVIKPDIFTWKSQRIIEIQIKKENLEFNKLEDENNHLPDYQQFLERNNTFS